MDLEQLGKNIKEARLRTNLPQQEFCKKIGVSQTFYCNIENGKKTPSLESLFKIADGLGVQAGELLLNCNSPSSKEFQNQYLSKKFDELNASERLFVYNQINCITKELINLRQAHKEESE